MSAQAIVKRVLGSNPRGNISLNVPVVEWIKNSIIIIIIIIMNLCFNEKK